MINANSTVIDPLLRKVSYDSVTNFEPICYLVSFPQVIVVNSASPYRSLNDLLAARALATTPAKRIEPLPNVPTIADTLPGFVNFGWYSIVAPKGTPEAVLAKAGAEVVKAAREPALGERLKTLGIEIIGGGRKELDDFRTKERKRLTELVKATGISIGK